VIVSERWSVGLQRDHDGIDHPPPRYFPFEFGLREISCSNPVPNCPTRSVITAHRRSVVVGLLRLRPRRWCQFRLRHHYLLPPFISSLSLVLLDLRPRGSASAPQGAESGGATHWSLRPTGSRPQDAPTGPFLSPRKSLAHGRSRPSVPSEREPVRLVGLTFDSSCSRRFAFLGVGFAMLFIIC
jgi:hypothetical protein